MVIHKHEDGVNTIFYTMVGPLVNNTLEKWLGLIRRGSYQAASEDIRRSYEPVSDLWPYIDTDSDYSDDESSDKGIKDQDKPDDKGGGSGIISMQEPKRDYTG